MGWQDRRTEVRALGKGLKASKGECRGGEAPSFGGLGVSPSQSPPLPLAGEGDKGGESRSGKEPPAVFDSSLVIAKG